ncbi:ABC transporter ATP-binding protein [Mycetocola tolaasinivorans]|uniref:ABC transporter ATP-binding protein n=1 Tax=Mycetocola tolaasinivorans TaxID=76635 RepID=A0A3L7A4K2_9MICO|nr:ABC transporter ATP-binding protein [Mycetocola tolaasinivorans]RLP74501.1 ABC transporter ATP-binding protein [Mycetocola tolaasinivorans]
MSLISLQDVTFSYPNGVLAVEGVSMKLSAGESVAIVGQNGAGKSTTVKMMNGLLRPTSGEIIVAGVNTRERTTAQVSREVGYVFQNPDDQIFNSSVRKEIEYGLKRMKLDEDEIERRVDDAAELTGMAPFLEENPFDLPLSIRKFVTITSVIASDCAALILDEPTAGQDRAGLERLGELIRTLQARGKAVVTITHDMEFVAANFERIIVMANRRVVTEGSPSAIFYDREAMAEARLNPPAVAEVAAALGCPEVGLDVTALARVLTERAALARA